MTKKTKRPSWATSFLTITRYELLWNIRKKKFIGVFILAFVFPTLALALPVVFSNLNNQPIQPNPDYVITTGAGLGGLGFFLFALVTVMNSISGEFESGSIIPLLTKPVSRTTVYLGKIFAALLTVLGAYVVLTIYMTAGGFIIYGPQNNLHLIFLTLLGSIMSTLVWMSIVLAAGSVSKSSMLAALLGIGVWFGLNIASGVISVFSNQAWIATYFPGSGASGSIGTPGPINQINMTRGSVSTGTDGIAANLINYILDPAINVTFYRIDLAGIGQGPGGIIQVPMYSEPLSLIVARSIAVATVYILVFNFIAWYALKRAQIAE
jgi:ABC-type transport system involved in multi-copper enzyme maturation permease subunit